MRKTSKKATEYHATQCVRRYEVVCPELAHVEDLLAEYVNGNAEAIKAA